MKILIFHPMLVSPTGGERQVLAFANELQKKGHSVDIFCIFADKNNCFPELMSNLNIHPLREGMSYSFLRKSYLFSRRSYRFHFLLKELNAYLEFISFKKLADLPVKGYEIINCHNYPTQWAGYAAKKKMKIPAVWMCNEPPFWYFQNTPFKFVSSPLYSHYDRKAVNMIDRIIVLDELNKKRVRQIYDRDSTVIRSGLEYQKFAAADGEDARQKLGISKDTLLLLQVGTLKHYKRQSDCIRAVNKLNNSERVKLLFVGDGEDYDALRSLADQLNVSDRIIFQRNVGDDELPQYYSASDIFLFPADQTWGLAVTEAMAARKCCIVSKASGVSEIITDNKNGFLFEHGNFCSMAEIIDQLIEDPRRREDVGNNAQEFVKQELSWSSYTERMLSEFRKCFTSESK
jgi:glycosyltransferase involved in cell wall biosynthesis